MRICVDSDAVLIAYTAHKNEIEQKNEDLLIQQIKDVLQHQVIMMIVFTSILLATLTLTGYITAKSG